MFWFVCRRIALFPTILHGEKVSCEFVVSHVDYYFFVAKQAALRFVAPTICFGFFNNKRYRPLSPLSSSPLRVRPYRIPCSSSHFSSSTLSSRVRPEIESCLNQLLSNIANRLEPREVFNFYRSTAILKVYLCVGAREMKAWFAILVCIFSSLVAMTLKHNEVCNAFSQEVLNNQKRDQIVVS